MCSGPSLQIFFSIHVFFLCVCVWRGAGGQLTWMHNQHVRLCSGRFDIRVWSIRSVASIIDHGPGHGLHSRLTEWTMKFGGTVSSRNYTFYISRGLKACFSHPLWNLCWQQQPRSFAQIWYILNEHMSGWFNFKHKGPRSGLVNGLMAKNTVKAH